MVQVRAAEDFQIVLQIVALLNRIVRDPRAKNTELRAAQATEYPPRFHGIAGK
jgi:hypothetical protein